MSNLEKLRNLMVRNGLAADSIREAASEQILPFGDLIFGDDDPSVDGSSGGGSCPMWGSVNGCDHGCASGCVNACFLSCPNASSMPT